MLGGGATPKQLNDGFDCAQNECILDFIETKKKQSCHLWALNDNVCLDRNSNYLHQKAITNEDRVDIVKNTPLTALRATLSRTRMAPKSPTIATSPKRGERAAFTLAETIIVVTILGIVAVLTVPALINRHIEATNRTKIKKAMAVYEQALNNMVISNGIKSNDDLYDSASAFAPSGDCSKTINYFKVSKKLDENDQCKFMTSDRVYWDITDINQPIVALKEEFLTSDEAADPYKTNAFYLIGRFDDNGILRVDDNYYESVSPVGDSNIYTGKLFAYIDNTKFCITNKCKIERGDYEEICGAVRKKCTRFTNQQGTSFESYDENGNLIHKGQFCEAYTNKSCYDFWIYERDKDGNITKAIMVDYYGHRLTIVDGNKTVLEVYDYCTNGEDCIQHYSSENSSKGRFYIENLMTKPGLVMIDEEDEQGNPVISKWGAAGSYFYTYDSNNKEIRSGRTCNRPYYDGSSAETCSEIYNYEYDTNDGKLITTYKTVRYGESIIITDNSTISIKPIKDIVDGKPKEKYEIKGEFPQFRNNVRTFANTDLNAEWVYLRHPQPQSYELSADSFILHGTDVTLEDIASPTFIALRQEDFCGKVSVKVNLDNGEAGVTFFMDEQQHYDLAVSRSAEGSAAMLKLNIGDIKDRKSVV